jgi:hypothetical protein
VAVHATVQNAAFWDEGLARRERLLDG